MPKVPPAAIATVFYLYPSVEAAERGVNAGGTGTLVLKEIAPGSNQLVYAVTNWHVAVEAGCSVVRLNKIGGGTDIFDFGPEDWVWEPKSYDIAAIPIAVNVRRHAVRAIASSMFLSREKVSEFEIGPGEDVFMVGRFIDHDGVETNNPSLRFGNISLMPSPIIQGPAKMRLDSFCIDLHSRSGYSGSPVFAYRTIGQDLTSDKPFNFNNYLQFLGLHFGQFPELWEIVQGENNSKSRLESTLIKEGNYVKGMSGMTCVVPAWAILDLLDHPRLVAAFREAQLVENKSTNRPASE